MESITYKKATEHNPLLKFVAKATGGETLQENEYYALMVVDYHYPMNGSPHVLGIEPQERIGLVGIECTGRRAPYISKQYAKRANSARGVAVVVEVRPEDVAKCCLLDSTPENTN